MDKTKEYRPPVDVKGAALYTGFGEGYLNKLRCTGGGPVFIKRNGVIRYCPDDLDAWIDAGKLSSTSGIRKGLPRKRKASEEGVAA